MSHLNNLHNYECQNTRIRFSVYFFQSFGVKNRIEQKLAIKMIMKHQQNFKLKREEKNSRKIFVKKNKAFYFMQN